MGVSVRLRARAMVQAEPPMEVAAQIRVRDRVRVRVGIGCYHSLAQIYGGGGPDQRQGPDWEYGPGRSPG